MIFRGIAQLAQLKNPDFPANHANKNLNVSSDLPRLLIRVRSRHSAGRSNSFDLTVRFGQWK